VHRIESHFRTIGERNGPRIVSAHSFGTLARIDGAVPSYGSGENVVGLPVTRYENWQHGVGVVTYQPGDGPYDVDARHIDTANGYATRFDGIEFLPECA
jgi:hypothetical protein